MPRRKKHHEPLEPAAESPPDEEVRGQTAELPKPKPPAAPEPAGLTITYLGDPKDGGGPETSTFAGIAMRKGEPVTVTDAAWIDRFGFRFRRNRHFRVG